ncbi:hypothetical protein ILYODFUR_011457 [Ilyodon furcidens]|uniref:Uncharacterized protein n=1 Tax=Ilyodon furcidens TaxID=33524 RepID=A0ABV0TLT7_9TELE
MLQCVLSHLAPPRLIPNFAPLYFLFSCDLIAWSLLSYAVRCGNGNTSPCGITGFSAHLHQLKAALSSLPRLEDVCWLPCSTTTLGRNPHPTDTEPRREEDWRRGPALAVDVRRSWALPLEDGAARQDSRALDDLCELKEHVCRAS